MNEAICWSTQSILNSFVEEEQISNVTHCQLSVQIPVESVLQALRLGNTEKIAHTIFQRLQPHASFSKELLLNK